MRALFVHPTFPGPFGAQVAGLGLDPDTEVVFITEHMDEPGMPGVRCLLMSGSSELSISDLAERELVQTFRRSARTANALLQLRREGFTPDIVCVSSASGCGLCVPDIFPKARRVVHADWFHTEGAFLRYVARDIPETTTARWRMRNLWRVGTLTDAHATFTSTEWQKIQFPAALAPNMRVLPQGVDTSLYAPADPVPYSLLLPEIEEATELLSFAGRSLDAFRGCPRFIRALPRILDARPGCHVLLFDSRNDAYGPRPTLRGDSAASAFEDFYSAVPRAEHRDRIHWLGRRSVTEYRHLLRASSVHVHLTAPCAASFTLLEAMSCGSVVLASDTEPVRELLSHNESGFLIPFGNPDAALDSMAKAAIDLLDRVAAKDPMVDAVRAAARATVKARFDRAMLIPEHVRMLKRME